MAKHVLKDAVVSVNAVTLTTYVQSVTVETSRPEVDVTGMGASAMEIIPGILDATITINFFQDYAAGAVDATIWPLATSSTPVTVAVKVASGAISATNPEYQMSSLVYSYSPVAGDVGSANATEVTFRNAASTGLVRDITP